jgi:hypothetical protein
MTQRRPKRATRDSGERRSDAKGTPRWARSLWWLALGAGVAVLLGALPT